MPPAKFKKKFYAVAVGRKTGIFSSWEICKTHVTGFAGAKYKGFGKEKEAQDFLEASRSQSTSNSAKRKDGDNVNVNKNPYDYKRPRLASTQQEEEQKQQQPKYVVYIQVHMMFDGGSRGNPGVAGAGAIMTSQYTEKIMIPSSSSSTLPSISNNAVVQTTKNWENRKVTSIREYLPAKGVTNNQAEFHGLCVGLEHANKEIHKIINDSKDKDNKDKDNDNDVLWKVDLNVQGDSQLVIRQVMGEYECRSKFLQPYLKKAKGLLKAIPEIVILSPMQQQQQAHFELETELEHVLRKFNSQADALANEAMDGKRSWTSVTVDGVEQT
eukprot:CAMPEP_0198150864 /NCGR_PEP_ID=MMETSP1443-20131203/52893_1 /TAXON_ID=186043 /ORGANISM="Entomoneis sp., Strain CCMP2396" /LENGTH=325 /DNA_ID=CAMNT_0043816321 /DNA_START=134 /DNA_END=1111 /DNA_ORIENTATION=-